MSKRTRRFAGDDDLIITRPAPRMTSEEPMRPQIDGGLDADILRDASSERPNDQG